MNSNVFFNRIEILLYSTLISTMSGLNHLRAHVQHSAEIPTVTLWDDEVEPTQLDEQSIDRTQNLRWISIKEAIIPLLLWVILGFAAGFLIGMIRTG